MLTGYLFFFFFYLHMYLHAILVKSCAVVLMGYSMKVFSVVGFCEPH